MKMISCICFMFLMFSWSGSASKFLSSDKVDEVSGGSERNKSTKPVKAIPMYALNIFNNQYNHFGFDLDKERRGNESAENLPQNYTVQRPMSPSPYNQWELDFNKPMEEILKGLDFILHTPTVSDPIPSSTYQKPTKYKGVLKVIRPQGRQLLMNLVYIEGELGEPNALYGISLNNDNQYQSPLVMIEGKENNISKYIHLNLMKALKKKFISELHNVEVGFNLKEICKGFDLFEKVDFHDFSKFINSEESYNSANLVDIESIKPLHELPNLSMISNQSFEIDKK